MPEIFGLAVSILLGPIIVFVIVLVCITLLKAVALKFGLIDAPGGRKRHAEPTPVVGGLAIYIGLMLSVLSSVSEISWSQICFLTSITIVVFVGALDDVFGLSIWARLSSQVVACLLVIGGSDVWIKTLGFGLFGDLPVWVGIGITVFSVVGLTNSINMIDGIDGLAAAQVLAMISCLSVCLYLLHGFVPNLYWLIIFCSAVLAFLLVNLAVLSSGPVFLGDAGSLLLGFISAWIVIYYTQGRDPLLHPLLGVWLVVVPVIDTVIVIGLRLYHRKSPFSSDRTHLHLLLVDLGIQHRVVLTLIICFSVGLTLGGASISHFLGLKAGLLGLAFCFLGIVIVRYYLSRLNQASAIH